MAHSPRTRVPFRRRREGRTDYRARLGLLKSGETRVVVRRTNGNVIVQFVDWAETGDQVKATAVGQELAKMGWKGSAKSTPAAYLTGLLAGKRAMEHGIDEAVLDIGRHAAVKGSKVFAALKGVVDAGVHVPHGEGMFPGEDRLTGAFLDQKKNFEAVRGAMGATSGPQAGSSASDDAADPPSGVTQAAKSSDEEEE